MGGKKTLKKRRLPGTVLRLIRGLFVFLFFVCLFAFFICGGRGGKIYVNQKDESPFTISGRLDGKTFGLAKN